MIHQTIECIQQRVYNFITLFHTQDMKKWEARAEERLSGQRLQDEDMVWLRAPAELSGKRAVVVTAKGVPGLDRVRCLPVVEPC